MDIDMHVAILCFQRLAIDMSSNRYVAFLADWFMDVPLGVYIYVNGIHTNLRFTHQHGSVLEHVFLLLFCT